MLKVKEKVTFIWQNIHPEKFDPYVHTGCTDMYNYDVDIFIHRI